MSYFKELPNLQFVNRFPNAKSNDEVTVAKNLFRRAKLREDLASVVSAFDYYLIPDGERPEQTSQRIYNNPEYDWVILVANNILNVYDEWPLSTQQLNDYLNNKYSEEAGYFGITVEQFLELPHHFETLELRDSYGRIVLPAGLIVDEAFYNSPIYQTLPIPAGVIFPDIYLDPIVATPVSVLGTGNTSTNVTSVVITNQGRGYTQAPNVLFSEPTTTANATASVGISSFTVTSIVGLNTGKGYRTIPNVVISSPPTSVQGIITCTLGTNLDEGRVVSATITNSGVGYGNTAPTLVFDLPKEYTTGATYSGQSPFPVGNQLDGMYVRSDGTKLYTSSGFGNPLLAEYTLTTPWDVTSIVAIGGSDVSPKFSYCSGIELSPDGTKMYAVGGKSGNFFVARYDLATPWSISSGVFASQKSLTAPGGVRFKYDGTKMFILNSNSPDSIEEYNVSIPWDITSSTYVTSYNIETPTNDNGILGFSFNSDGTKMYATGLTNATIYEFDMQSWNLSTLQYNANLYVGDRLGNPSDVYVSPDITRLFLCGGTGDRVFQYTIKVRTTGYATLSNGSIDSVVITNAGYGYTVPPNVTVSSPYPAITATAVANVTSGFVTSITITNPGFGYTTTPTLTIDTAPTYSTATGIASVSDGKLVSINIISSGSNYDTPPVITLYGDPGPTLNTPVGSTYSQGNTTWRWDGTEWQQKVVEEFKYFDGSNIVNAAGNGISMPISYYEYEVQLNEKKRIIIIPKPQYITTIVSDLKNIMKYDKKNTDTINSKLKTTYNSKLSGV